MAQLLEATAVRPRVGLAGHEPNHEALLRDDRHFFAPYFGAPVARGAFLLAHPGARERIERLAGRISNRRAARMNHAVELEARAPDLAAAELLHDLKLM